MGHENLEPINPDQLNIARIIDFVKGKPTEQIAQMVSPLIFNLIKNGLNSSAVMYAVGDGLRENGVTEDGIVEILDQIAEVGRSRGVSIEY